MIPDPFKLLKEIALFALVAIACFGIGWFSHMLANQHSCDVKIAQTETLQAARNTAQAQKAAATSNALEKDLNSHDAAIDAAVAKAKAKLQPKPQKPVFIVQPAKPDQVCTIAAPVLPHDPDADWRDFADGVNSVLSEDHLDPGARGDPASVSAGVQDGQTGP